MKLESIAMCTDDEIPSRDAIGVKCKRHLPGAAVGSGLAAGARQPPIVVDMSIMAASLSRALSLAEQCDLTGTTRNGHDTQGAQPLLMVPTIYQ